MELKMQMELEMEMEMQLELELKLFAGLVFAEANWCAVVGVVDRKLTVEILGGT